MPARRVHLGSDHAGLELKAHLVGWLVAQGHEPVDHGPRAYDPVDDYPPYVLRAAVHTVDDVGSLGIVIGGSGNGEAIAANKVVGVRCALAWTVTTAQLAREHNDANVLSLGARQYDLDHAVDLVAAFLGTDFSGDPRHVRRIAMIDGYERGGALPPLED